MWRMSLFTRAAATLAATAVVLAPSAFSAAHAAAPLPHDDPFYGYGTPPGGSNHGDVLSSRSVQDTLTDVKALLAGATTTFSAPATQVLYRTQNELGDPAQTVTTVFKPAGASRGVVAYLSFYDGLGDSCDPSYTLQSPSAGMEAAVIGTLIESGYTVTVPDFEGETHDWAAGHEAGWSTLDAIKATESSLSLPATTPVGLMGYSGGSIAGDWASELAGSYAPELKLVGTAIGGVPAKLDDVMRYVDGSTDPDGDGIPDAVDFNSRGWAGVIPAALVSLGRANGYDFTQYESTTSTYTNPTTHESLTGQEITDRVKDQCIADFAGKYPGLHASDLLAPAYRTLLDVPHVAGIVAKNEMGTGGTPTMPMLIVQGNKDGTGDGVMVASDVKKLAGLYGEDVPVTYTELAGQDHTAAGQSFVISALGFLDRLLPPAADKHGPTAPQLAAVSVKLKGHSRAGSDVLVVKAKGVAKGTKVKLFAKGHKKAVAHGKLDKHGKLTVSVRDHNGAKKTRYQAVVKATATTASGTSKVLKLR